MTETILLLPGVNGTELIRMMARFRKDSFGLRIMNAAEFARFALMRSGTQLKENFLPRKQEPAVIDSFIRDISYFASAGYADSEKIADTLYSLRSLIAEQEWDTIHDRLPNGEFSDKNRSLVAVYERYLATLKDANNTDTIGLLRKALAEAAPLTCPVYTLKEYPLSPLEEALLNALSTQRIHSGLQEFLNVASVPLDNIDYAKSYGSSNEVAAIFDYILANKLPLDACVVAAANTAQYSQLFYDFSQSHDLPITLSISLHAPDDATRTAIMPVNNKWGVDALLAACRRYYERTQRRISFEYTLISGKNDTPEQAEKLARVLNSRLRGNDRVGAMPIHVNLIPVNEVSETGFVRSDEKAIRAFAKVLESRGIRATVRRKLGPDINASCGQLRRAAMKNES